MLFNKVKSSLRGFLLSESGAVVRKAALPLVWVVGSLTATAALLGLPMKIEATCPCTSNTECDLFCCTWGGSCNTSLNQCSCV